MPIENKQKVLGLMGLSARARKVTFGTDACCEAIKRKKIHFLILAEDASEKTRQNFIFLCEKEQIPYAVLGKIEEISKAIGKKNKAVIGIEDINLANEIAKKFKRG